MWIIAKCVHIAGKLQNVHIWKSCLPNVDIWLHVAKFCHFFTKSNDILPFLHNRHNLTRIKFKNIYSYQ